ncbi:MAG TPA: HAD family phosphatase [Streptosporangiaceae bacterium]|nr:HAD family phosphatase [Streptosporangiaceae bacterium]
MALRGLIFDWGGVLTSPLADSIAAWLAADRIDAHGYRTVMRAWVAEAYAGGGPNPIHGLEDGTLDPAEFERLLAAELRTVDGGPVAAQGLLRRMFESFAPVEQMYAVLRTARRRDLSTGLLSNSWGNDYPRELWAELFDAVVISSEVGLRKPDERIYRHAAAALGLDPGECVFVDDIEHNIRAAEAVGMVGVHHVSPEQTVDRLEELFRVPLRDR